MKTRGLLRLCMVVSAFATWMPPETSSAAEFKAGLATVDITPPIGYRMSGYFYERLNTATHDPLLAKAVVFEQGEEKAALIFCDLVGVSREVSSRARRIASEQTGIPMANILIAATHSHTGPLYSGALREQFHGMAIAKSGTDPCEAIDYPADLGEKLGAVAGAAQRRLQPAHLRTARTEVTTLSFNRRFHMKDGSVVFNPGKLNTNIVRVAGPIDPELLMLFVEPANQERPAGALTSFALHADTVGGTEYSGDFPYYLAEALRAKFGPAFVSLFGNGTCGDINHIDVSNKLPQKGQVEAHRIGEALGAAVIEAVPRLKPVSNPTLKVASRTVTVPLQQYSEEAIKHARECMPKIGTGELKFLEQVEACKIVDLQLRRGNSLPLEVQVFRLGADTAIVGLPGEIFVEHGLAIKRGSPFQNTFVIELCNDGIGYVPTEKAFREGSYEVVNSRVQSGGGEMLVQTALELLRGLKR